MTAAELALDLMEVAALLATLALVLTRCRMSRIACQKPAWKGLSVGRRLNSRTSANRMSNRAMLVVCDSRPAMGAGPIPWLWEMSIWAEDVVISLASIAPSVLLKFYHKQAPFPPHSSLVTNTSMDSEF